MLGTIRNSSLWKDLLGVSDDYPRKKKPLLAKVKAGDVLEFGIVPLPELSQKSVIVATPTIYHFNGSQFYSHPLLTKDFQLICHMIVAQKEGASPYLALSRKIPDAHKFELCTPEDYKSLCRANYPQHLYVREHTAGMRDWLYMHYECKLKDMKGTSIAPDNDVKSFHYTLYLSQEEHKALEIERYPSGEFDAYATLFLPASVIVRLEQNAAAAFAYRMAQEAPAMIAEKPLAETYAFSSQQPTQKDQETHVQPELERLQEKGASSRQQEEHTEHKAVASESEPAQQAVMKQHDSAKIFTLPRLTRQQSEGALMERAGQPLRDNSNTVRLNLRMASKLIDEAMRNDMRVTDVMRKALGLSVTEQDYVAFDLRLDERDYTILADRFDLDSRDKEKIHALIMEELRDFTGEPLE